MRGERKSCRSPATQAERRGALQRACQQELALHSPACVRASVRARRSCGSARCTVAWHIAVNTQLKRRGLTISGSENVSNPVFQVAKSSERTVAHCRRVTARILLARRGTKVGIYRKWKNARGVFPREVYDSTIVAASAEVFFFLRRREEGTLVEGVDKCFFFPTLCLGRERHTAPGGTLSKLLGNTSTPCCQRRGFLRCTCWIILARR